MRMGSLKSSRHCHIFTCLYRLRECNHSACLVPPYQGPFGTAACLTDIYAMDLRIAADNIQAQRNAALVIYGEGLSVIRFYCELLIHSLPSMMHRKDIQSYLLGIIHLCVKQAFAEDLTQR